MYFDAHTHLINDNELKKMQKKGVQHIIVNSTKEDDWDKVIQLSLKYKNVYPCIGIHPWFIKDISNNWIEKMENLLQKYPFLMIGEIGLDFMKEGKEKQIDIFYNSLKLAQKYNRQVHIHCVKAWNEMLPMIKKFSMLKYLFHRYNGSREITQQLLNFNSYFSINNLSNKTNIPTTKILVETDTFDSNQDTSSLIEAIQKLNLDNTLLFNNFKNFIQPMDEHMTREKQNER